MYCVECPLDEDDDKCILDREWTDKLVDRDTKRLEAHADKILAEQKEIPQG